MDEVIRSLSGAQFIGLVSVLMGGVFLTVSSLAGVIMPHWRKARQVEAEMLLKRDLVAAGFSADDIERVVRASCVGRPASTSRQPVAR